MKGFDVRCVSDIFDSSIDYCCAGSIFIQRDGRRVVFNDIGKQVASIYVRAYAAPSGIELIAGLCDMKLLPVDNTTDCFYLISL